MACQCQESNAGLPAYLMCGRILIAAPHIPYVRHQASQSQHGPLWSCRLRSSSHYGFGFCILTTLYGVHHLMT